MKTITIPISLPEEKVFLLNKIAENELSSRNRILKIAILEYIKKMEFENASN